MSPEGRVAAVAERLMGLLETVPGREMAASALCSALYKACAEAKDVVSEHGGLKKFITTPSLEHAVRFVADEVCVHTSNACTQVEWNVGGRLG